MDLKINDRVQVYHPDTNKKIWVIVDSLFERKGNPAFGYSCITNGQVGNKWEYVDQVLDYKQRPY